MATYTSNLGLKIIAGLSIMCLKYTRYTPATVPPGYESYYAQLGGNASTVTLSGDYLACPVTLSIVPQLATEQIMVTQIRKETVPAIDVSNSGTYYDPRVTDIIFSFSSIIPAFNVQLDLNSIFLPINIGRMEIMILHNGQWDTMDSQISDGVISFAATPGTYAVCLNAYAYSSLTQRMANLLPSWMAIRTNPSSTGQQFLNYFGVELDDVSGYLDWTLGNFFIGSTDTDMLDHAYRGVFPTNMQPGQPVKVIGNDHQAVIITDQYEFMRSNSQVVLFDYVNGLIHTKVPYQGYLLVVYNNQEYTVDLAYHQVWNAFDEFALLLGVTRWSGEANSDLRERILDVFRYPANATQLGLYQSIGRSLNFVRRATWPDDSMNFVIHDHSIIDGTVLVDGVHASIVRVYQ